MPQFELAASILPPTDDRIFKLLLTHPDAKTALMDLVSCIIGRTVTDVIVVNNEIPVTDTDEKQARLDVNCTIDGGELINIEMQASPIETRKGSGHRNLKNKAVYYLCDLFSSQSSKGKAYDELSKTIQITFCAYTVFPERTSFVHEFRLKDDKGSVLTDALGVVFIELSKLGEVLQKSVDEMTSLEMWSLFLAYADDPHHRGVVNRIIAEKEEINVASNLLASISQDDRERALIRSRRKYQSDLESNLRTSYLNGVTEGKIEVARELLADGMDINVISKSVKIPVEVLAKELGHSL